ncbi:MAG TPA: cobalamin-independent methionine synthase II family protein [Hyphomicrobiales bacterium]|nr:cobalamin-independent methionine synthase II family protein [Hyphomicrobiales bacterium]
MTHVGSLPRPAPVVDLLARREAGEPVDPTAFESIVGTAVRDVVRRQIATGMDVVSDGETGKVNYGTYVKDRLTGFSGALDGIVARDVRDYPEFRRKMALLTGTHIQRRAACTGPVSYVGEAEVRADLTRLRAATAAAAAEEAFVNAASPGVVTVFLPNRHYPSYAAYLEAVAAAMRHEYRLIVEAGFLLQVDCPDLAMGRHTAFQDLSDAEFLKQAALQVEALNVALDGIPAERVRMHLCWGNYEGPHDHDVPLASIIGIVLEAKPQAILFEAANPRHEHEWTVWRDARLPDDKILVPGVVSTTTNYVEHPDLVAERLGRFAAIVGRERVIAGTDCGFGTSAGFGKMDPEISYRKLEALAEGARRASQRLWGRAPDQERPIREDPIHAAYTP